MTIRELVPGEHVEGFFALRKIERREFQGGERLALEFGDRSGRIDGVMWEGFNDVIDDLVVGWPVKVRGVVGTYRDRPQIRVERIRPAQTQEVRPEDFLPRSPVEPAVLARELDRFIDSLSNPHLRALLAKLLCEEPLRSQYLSAPAGKLWHHDTIGGLAEHSLNMARLCEFTVSLYPDLDRDLLVCGALLHDIGKIEQYEVSALIDYSDAGRLIGHINTGDFRVATAIRALDGFPAGLERVLRHLIVSHQGGLEYGSPIVPQTPEAFVLYYADELDSKMGALRHIAEKTGDRDWSDYVNLINRHIYFGHRRATPEQEA
ncbi:MAG: HD domain-containing protein [Candidatus Zixiibacteriota bacterium]